MAVRLRQAYIDLTPMFTISPNIFSMCQVCKNVFVILKLFAIFSSYREHILKRTG